MWVFLEVIFNDNIVIEYDVVVSVISEDFDVLMCEFGLLGMYVVMVFSMSEFMMKYFVMVFLWLIFKIFYVFVVG